MKKTALKLSSRNLSAILAYNVAMRLLPNIGPLDSVFPLFAAPRLRVVARGVGIPAARRDTTLTIEVTNLAPEPVEVRSIHVGYMYTNLLTEATFGKSAPRFVLSELAGATPPPFTLGVDEPATWTTNLRQLAEGIEERRLTLGPHSSLVDLKRVEEDFVRGIRRGRASVKIRNVVASWSFRRLAVVVGDDRGSLYKTKVRWQPPSGAPPDHRSSSLSRA